jgi:hypothetical protein
MRRHLEEFLDEHVDHVGSDVRGRCLGGEQQQKRVGCEVADPVAAVRLVGLTVPALRHGDGTRLGRQVIEDGPVRTPRVGRPRKKEHGRIEAATLIRGRQGQTAGEGDPRHDGTLRRAPVHLGRFDIAPKTA